MKFLIWTVCVVIAAMIMVLLDNLGLFTGALWKTLIFAAMCTTATILCKKLDKKRDKKEENLGKSRDTERYKKARGEES